jgi:hypothetical protein
MEGQFKSLQVTYRLENTSNHYFGSQVKLNLGDSQPIAPARSSEMRGASKVILETFT